MAKKICKETLAKSIAPMPCDNSGYWAQMLEEDMDNQIENLVKILDGWMVDLRSSHDAILRRAYAEALGKHRV